MIKLARTKHLAKYVFILIDEIYLKEGLVYNKSTGSLIGFADLGGTVQQLSDYEESLSSDSTTRPLAKTIMVFMVQGVFCNLRFPYANFQWHQLKHVTFFHCCGKP